MENMLVGAGIVFMAGALIGGGLSAFGVTLPLFSSIKRQVLLFLLGAALLAAGAFINLNPRPAPGPTPTENKTGPTEVNMDGGAEGDTQGNEAKPADSGSVMGPLEMDVNRDAYDFDNKGVHADNPYDCSELCRVNDQCVAMTYVVSRRTCWLKKAVPPPKAQPDHVSAVKYKP